MAQVFEHIARRLGISSEEAAERCRKATSDLLATLEAAGHATVAGLGRFSRTDAGLRFEPEPRLAAVVNHRFAGLYPIPVEKDVEGSLGLKPVFAVPDVPVAPKLVDDSAESASTVDLGAPADSHDSMVQTDTASESASGEDVEPLIFAPTDENTYSGPAASRPWARTEEVLDSVRHEVDESDVPEDLVDHSESAERREAEQQVDETGPQQAEPAWNRPAQFPEPVNPNDEVGDDYLAESEYARAAEEADDFGGTLMHPSSSAETGDAMGSQEKPVAEPVTRRLRHKAAEKTVARPGAPVVVRKSRISRAYWLLIPILVIAIGAVLWLLRESERSEPPTQQAAVPAAADTLAPVDEVEGAVGSEGDQEPTSVAGGEDLSSEEAPRPDSPADVSTGTGTGEAADPVAEWQPGAVDRRRGGYTLVVSSQATRREAIDFARNVVANLRDESLPVDIFQGTARGRSRYRVGVGQFESIEEALSEMDRLTPRLPEGAWVLRIRTNM